ncbi:deoxyribose-phosphate aldolase [Enterococcus sp. CSURQ0835]|uniref:deoxyribose-phosphate aldolase n=1 Tax=Enterococcus sp. CSURQ0835 TaxID=2681394 RepID=UPI00135720A6|nr:deoxyribose-phosphate aldolase [Enterococcus sp. CSURQ0835]
MTNYSLTDFAQLIDHTNLKPDATPAAIKQLCQEARDHHFKMVAVNQVQTALCAAELKTTSVHVGAAISFPLGQTTIAAKVFETSDAIKNGATEIDYVVNLTAVKQHDWEYIEKEMLDLVTICHAANVLCKVVFENAYLTEAEKIQLAQIAKKIRPDFIKTSTGFGPSGATIADVTLMKQIVGSTVGVKAAGGIRDAATFKAMITAGATRIGTSAGLKILTELKAELAAAQATTLSL